MTKEKWMSDNNKEETSKQESILANRVDEIISNLQQVINKKSADQKSNTIVLLETPFSAEEVSNGSKSAEEYLRETSPASVRLLEYLKSKGFHAFCEPDDEGIYVGIELS